MPKIKFAYRTTYNSGKTVSKIPKPKDWAHRTPSEGRPKLINPKLKKLKMKQTWWDENQVHDFLLKIKAGIKECEWNVSCEYPRRNLTQSDVLKMLIACFHSIQTIEVKINTQSKIVIFCDLEDFFILNE